MQVLLTHGFFLGEDEAERRVGRPYPPLGLLYLSSHLKARGVAVQIFDSTFETRDAFDARLAATAPGLIGFSANLMTRRSVLAMMARARRTRAVIAVGGPDPSNYPDEYLARGADIVVIGEGELTLEHLANHVARQGLSDLSSIDGIAYRDETGAIVRTAPRAFLTRLDEQPFPDRDAIDIPRYIDTWRTSHGVGSVSLITARGCPYTCTWCSHSVFGYSHRRRSPANVADEVEIIAGRWHPDLLWYADDVFTINHRWLMEYAAELARRGLRIPFETISREDRLNETVVQTLAGMGCRRLWIGSESGSQRVMDAMDRGADVARVRDVVRLLQRHGIEAGLFVMLGYEDEEETDLELTVRHLKACGADHVLTTLAYPIKGTPYYERVADRIVSPCSWDEGSDRDHAVAGRHSRRYYGHATRWILNEIATQAEWDRPHPRLHRLARSFVGARWGRLGMRMTSRQREGRREDSRP